MDENIAIDEPTGKSNKNERRIPIKQHTIPHRGENKIIFLIL